MRYEYVMDGMRWHILPEDMNENKFPYYITIFRILKVFDTSIYVLNSFFFFSSTIRVIAPFCYSYAHFY